MTFLVFITAESLAVTHIDTTHGETQTDSISMTGEGTQTDPRDLSIINNQRTPANRYQLDQEYLGTVTFEVDGQRYTIHQNSLMAFPETNLVIFVKRSEHEANIDDPILYDADPEIFRAALNFYRYGTLKRPFGVPKDTFQLGIRELGLEQFLDKDSMEEFDEVTWQMEELENKVGYTDTLLLMMRHSATICVNVLFPDSGESLDPRAFYLPPAISKQVEPYLRQACNQNLMRRGITETCCHSLKYDSLNAIHFEASSAATGLRLQRAVGGLKSEKREISGHEADFFFSVERK